MPRMLIVGMGYAARVIAARLTAAGSTVAGTTRDGRDGTIAFAGTITPPLADALARATHVLSSVPPAGGRRPRPSPRSGAS